MVRWAGLGGQMSAALLTPEEVAEHLHLTPYTIYVWLRSGRLPGIKLGHRWRVKPEDLDEFLARGRRRAPAAQPEQAAGQAQKPVWMWVQEMFQDVPQEEWDRLPDDLGDNVDHYLYGHPRRPASRCESCATWA